MQQRDDVSVEVSPLQAQGMLSGFLVSGRWPDNTVEWARFLLLAVRMASATPAISARKMVGRAPRRIRSIAVWFRP